MWDMNAVRLMALCLAVAMICAILRPVRPELAMAVTLGAGAAILGALALMLREALPQLDALRDMFTASDDALRSTALRAVGIAFLAELGMQICEDAGESAMAGRIALVFRVATLGMCLPLVLKLAESLSEILA